MSQHDLTDTVDEEDVEDQTEVHELEPGEQLSIEADESGAVLLGVPKGETVTVFREGDPANDVTWHTILGVVIGAGYGTYLIVSNQWQTALGALGLALLIGTYMAFFRIGDLSKLIHSS